jgi:hypothetical protein
MTNKLTSIDIITPVYNPRVLKLFLNHDPLGIGYYEPHNFDLKVFDTYEETSYARVVSGSGKIIKTGSEYNDYYGPGTSLSDPIDQAKQWIEDFGIREDTTIKIQVVVKLEDVVVFRSDEKPFYRGAVRMFHVSSGWFLQGTTSYDEQPPRNITEVVVWENGKWTDAASEIESLLMVRRSADVLGTERHNGTLKEVARFTQVE